MMDAHVYMLFVDTTNVDSVHRLQESLECIDNQLDDLYYRCQNMTAPRKRSNAIEQLEICDMHSTKEEEEQKVINVKEKLIVVVACTLSDGEALEVFDDTYSFYEYYITGSMKNIDWENNFILYDIGDLRYYSQNSIFKLHEQIKEWWWRDRKK